MPDYDYRCEHHGVFELTFPLAKAPETAACPECGADAPRSFGAPLTSAPRSAPSGPGRAPGPAPGRRPDLSHLPMTAPLRGGFPGA